MAENKEMVKEVVKSGKSGLIAGAVTLGLAGIGLVSTGKKVVGGVQSAVDKVFPKKVETTVVKAKEQEETK